MSTVTRFTLSALLLCLTVAASARAAEQQPTRTLSKEATAAGPAVDTSAAAADTSAAAVDTSAAAADANAPATATTKPNASQSPPADAAQPGTPPRSAGPRAAVRNDRLDLDTTVVTGNRELPKVLYIVPWKKSDLGDLPAQPFNTLLDEALTPVDRDVFRREVTYYDAINSEGGGDAAATAPQPPRSEK